MSNYVNIVLVVAAGWVAIGAGLSILMGRRGHNGFGWFVLGSMLGPLGLILAVDALRHEPAQEPARPVTGHAGGPVDVLVGYDGSPESIAALATVGDLLGERTGRVVIATVVSLDGIAAEERDAEKGLSRMASRVPTLPVATEVLHGRPSVALAQRAAGGGFDLLVIGTRGKGLTKGLMGSAASELVRDSKVPVLVVGNGHGGAA